MASFVTYVKCENSMGHYDINKISETILVPLLSEVFDLGDLDDLNALKHKNYPSIDLGDKTTRVAFQITADSSLEKIKDTLRKFIKHELFNDYDRLVFYILTERQSRYSDASLNSITSGRINFNPNTDVIDYRNLLELISRFQIDKAQRILTILESNFDPTHVKPVLIPDSTSHRSLDAGISMIYGLVDREIENQLRQLRKARFFTDFDSETKALRFGERLVGYDLSTGSASVKQKALSWCARVLSTTKLSPKAQDFLDLAKTLGENTIEIQIAEAFLASAEDNTHDGLSALARIDSPVARSASLMIVSHNQNAESTLKWLTEVGYTINDLDPDGKVVLLNLLLVLSQHEKVSEDSVKLNDSDYDSAPSLHFLVAMSFLLVGVPTDLHYSIRMYVPLYSARLPLPDTKDGHDRRRTAGYHFTKCAESARELECQDTAVLNEEYSIWMQLLNPDFRIKGQEKLRRILHDLSSSLNFVPLALEHDVDLDFSAVEKVITSQIALHGGATKITARARFALALIHDSPLASLAYINKHRDELLAWYLQLDLYSIEIDLLTKTGQLEVARHRLTEYSELGLDQAEIDRLDHFISQIDEQHPVESLIKQYENSQDISDLAILVGRLEHQEVSPELYRYSKKLYDCTKSLPSMLRFVRVLNSMRKDEEIVWLLRNNPEFMDQDENLRLYFCSSLYQLGKMVEAKNELTKVNKLIDHSSYFDLSVYVEMALGNWEILPDLITDELAYVDLRDAKNLIQTAQLAFATNSPHAKTFVFKAVEKGQEDARVFASVYYLALRAGWEDEIVYGWLQKAIELSGNNGLFHAQSIQEVINQKPTWDRQRNDILQQLTRGELPFFGVGKQLNRTLAELFLSPTIRNYEEQRGDHYSILPIFSGAREEQSLDLHKTIVALDGNVLLTLAFLEILEPVINSFKSVKIPHSTILWLFQEKEQSTFHQPARIEKAHELRQLLNSGLLEEFHPTVEPPEELSRLVGDELATLLTESVNRQKTKDTQYFVVQSYPVHTIESMMNEEADLSLFHAVLVSFSPVVTKLRQKGHLTPSEKLRALSVLGPIEKPWPNQPEIEDNSVLLLDGLAVHYLRSAGILGKLRKAGMRVMVAKSEIEETDALIQYETISDKINSYIESVRCVLQPKLASGEITFGESSRTVIEDEKFVFNHPTAAVVNLSASVDAIVVDDRYFNKHTYVDLEDHGPCKPIYTTIDLIDAMAGEERLSNEQWLDARTDLRRAGFAFIPVSSDELHHHLANAELSRGSITDTAELKAIRKNLINVGLHEWLQLPQEAAWIDSIINNFLSTIRRQWSLETEFTIACARSSWVLSLLVATIERLFTERDELEGLSEIKGQILQAILVPTDVLHSTIDNYHIWIEKCILPPIRKNESNLLRSVVDAIGHAIRNMIFERLKTRGIGVSNAEQFVIASFQHEIKTLPPSVRQELQS